MGRFERSWSIFKTSWQILMKDKRLLVLPLVSGSIILAICIMFAAGMGIFGGHVRASTAMALPMLLMYIVMYTVAIFFQAALVHAASERMQGRAPSLGASLGAASKRLGNIVLWGLVAGSVGALIRAIEDRSSLAGRFIAGIVGAAWSLVTIFVVPVIVLEDKPFGESLKRSWGIFKGTWGESAIGSAGLGLIVFLAVLAVFALGFLFGLMAPAVGIVVGALGLATVMVFTSTLQGIYVTGLYRYATTRDIPPGFEEARLSDVFA